MNFKIKLKFLAFFSAGLALFCLYIGLVMQLIFGVLFPALGMYSAESNSAIFTPALLFALLSGGALFSLYFVTPQLTLLSMVQRLSLGDYDVTTMRDKLYTRKGKLKPQYFLYSELVNDIYELSARLRKSETDRARLEEAKKEWIRGISHDLKTPLSYVLGYAALLAKEDYNWEDCEKQRFLEEITAKGKYMEQLISDLKLSIDEASDNGVAIMPITPERIDLVPFLQSIIVDIANQPSAADYSFGFDFGSESIEIEADAKLLYRAVQNLLTNAVSHTPSGTCISVSVTAEDDLAIMRFSDTGPGLEPEAVKTLTGSDMAVNSGKGLAVIRNIVLSHRGSISVDTSSGGTTITIKLPR